MFAVAVVVAGAGDLAGNKLISRVGVNYRLLVLSGELNLRAEINFALTCDRIFAVAIHEPNPVNLAIAQAVSVGALVSAFNRALQNGIRPARKSLFRVVWRRLPVLTQSGLTVRTRHVRLGDF